MAHICGFEGQSHAEFIRLCQSNTYGEAMMHSDPFVLPWDRQMINNGTYIGTLFDITK